MIITNPLQLVHLCNLALSGRTLPFNSPPRQPFLGGRWGRVEEFVGQHFNTQGCMNVDT